MKKSLVFTLGALVLTFTACTHTAKAQEARKVYAAASARAAKATYFRVWQGFKKTGLGDEQFAAEFPAFMQRTVDLYAGKLNNYIVVIPPVAKPSYIPDEFALVAMGKEEDYRSVRASPEGQAYGEAHWNYFDKTTSKSATMAVGLPETLESGVSYDLSGGAIDWRAGHTMFFLGTRKSGVSSAEFLGRLHEHVALALPKLKPLGMKGYIIIAHDNYEAAYINWESREAMERAFASVAGKSVGTDAASFMDVLMWDAVKPLKLPLASGVYDSSGGL